MVPGVVQYTSPEAFASSLGDACFGGDGALVWRVDGIEGASLWGRVTARAVDAAFASAYHHVVARIEVPARVVIDLTAVTGLDPEGYQRAFELTGEIGAELGAKIGQLTIVLPAGMLAAVAAGVLHLVGTVKPWTLARDLDAALGARAPRVIAIVDAHRRADEVRAVRAYLADHLDAGLADVARALGVSPRSLQRTLEGASAGFRALVEEARIEEAVRLLETSDLKVEAIALEVGYRSLSGFVRAFRRLRGTSPAEFRKLAA